MPTIKATKFFVQSAHKGQHDLQGKPYYEHLFAVEKLLPRPCERWMRHAALLHDLFEDTEHTAQDLIAMGYDHLTIAAVEILTRPKDVPYAEYIEGISQCPPGIIKIKIADLTHNMDQTRGRLPGPQRWKYERAREKLENELQDRLS